MKTSASHSPACYPPFAWDRTPIYQMFADGKLFTGAQVATIAPTSDFICIEKRHGVDDVGAADLGARHAIGQFKAVKPGMTCLAYLNSALAYPYISRAKVFDWRGSIHQPENAAFKALLIKDPATGELAFRESDHVHFFDVLNPDLRSWWVATAAALVTETGADGLFVDQMHGFTWLREDRAADVAAAQAEMMRMTKDALGGKVLLLNNAAHIPELFAIGDAFMFEHYQPALLVKDQIVADWALMKKIAAAGKIAVWRIGVEHDDLFTAFAPPPAEQADAVLEEIARKRVEYYLAAFLIGAQEYSYFQYGWGWDVRTGPLCRYPEFDKPLGKPLGDAVRVRPEGGIFRRDFEYASVMVDLNRRTGEVVGGESLKIVVACNGQVPVFASAEQAAANVEPKGGPEGVSISAITAQEKRDVTWSVAFERASAGDVIDSATLVGGPSYRLRLEVVRTLPLPVIGSDTPGAEEIPGGFEGGSSVKVMMDGKHEYHFFSHAYPKLDWSQSKLDHWVSSDGVNFSHVGVLLENYRDEKAGMNHIFCAPVPFYDDKSERWHLVYCEFVGPSTWTGDSGIMWCAGSKTAGMQGIGGPYDFANRYVLVPKECAKIGTATPLATSSSAPFKVKDGRWAVFVSTDYFSEDEKSGAKIRRWPVMLNFAASPLGPFDPPQEAVVPPLIDPTGFIENPMPLKVRGPKSGRDYWVTVFDFLAPEVTGFTPKNVFGFAWSGDGVYWPAENGHIVNLDDGLAAGEQGWWRGAWAVRTPHQMIDEGDGTFTVFFTGGSADNFFGAFRAVGKVTVRLIEEDSVVRPAQ